MLSYENKNLLCGNKFISDLNKVKEMLKLKNDFKYKIGIRIWNTRKSDLIENILHDISVLNHLDNVIRDISFDNRPVGPELRKRYSHNCIYVMITSGQISAREAVSILYKITSLKLLHILMFSTSDVMIFE